MNRLQPRLAGKHLGLASFSLALLLAALIVAPLIRSSSALVATSILHVLKRARRLQDQYRRANIAGTALRDEHTQ